MLVSISIGHLSFIGQVGQVDPTARETGDPLKDKEQKMFTPSSELSPGDTCGKGVGHDSLPESTMVDP